MFFTSYDFIWLHVHQLHVNSRLVLAWADKTKYNQLNGFTGRNLSSQVSVGWKFEIRVTAYLGPGESLLLACRWLTSHRVLTWQRKSKFGCLFLFL